jgi:quercetin dioxygenase-like cupin family protein
MSLTHIPDLAGLVPFDPDRRTSTVAFAAEGVRAVVFAFSAGQELTEHRAPAPILLQALEGELRVTAEGREVVLTPGGVLHLESGVPHSVVADVDGKLLLCILR